MRLLLVMRGATGSGKSTFIKENNLQPYTICPDDLRLLYQAPEIQENGKQGISSKNEKKVWQTVHELLEKRMKNGDLTVIDATHTRAKDFGQYKALVDAYRYRVVCVDFSHIDKETLHKQNQARPAYKIVPTDVVETFHERITRSEVPKWVTVVKPDAFQKFFQLAPLDFSSYHKIHHIGDVHGCFDALSSYLKEGLREDELYIFVGDYIDRGIQNAEVLTFLFTLMERKNVIFLEGNHEIHLWNWSNDRPASSKEFENFTKPALNEAGISKKATRAFYRSLRQCVFYTYGEKQVLVTHGGLTHIPKNLYEVSTAQLIKGVGDYGTEIDRIFHELSEENHYQLHGHRNTHEFPTQASPSSFNLEGKVERAGYLRATTLSSNGFDVHEIKNPTFSERFDTTPNPDATFPHGAFLQGLRNNPFIREKEQAEQNIASFNFTRDAFNKGIWDNQTMRARGLFMNTETTEIVARSYDKFFNVGEVPQSTLEYMKKNLVFPVSAYVKDNGFLGITGYDTQNDALIIASKSTTSGPFKEIFEHLLVKTLGENNLPKLKQYLKDNNVSFVFEVNDPVNDPHMVKYDAAHVVLLDIIERSPDVKKVAYEKVVEVAGQFGLTPKAHEKTCANWDEFYAWFENVSNDFSVEIEGYVIEDNDGFMTKIKLPYYSFWKWMRSVKDRIARGKELRPEVVEHPLAKEFVAWCENQQDKEALAETDIITLRKKFESEK